jgi:hypothetical protein
VKQKTKGRDAAFLFNYFLAQQGPVDQVVSPDPALAAAADLAPLLILTLLEKLLPAQRRFAGMRDLLMGDVTFVGIVAGNVPQVVPQLP